MIQWMAARNNIGNAHFLLDQTFQNIIQHRIRRQ